MKKANQKEIQIPVRGSLGLLAYGHKGLIAWRQAIIKAKSKNSSVNKELNEK